MCARLLACPLCSQPGFLTLDALRTGLISVATRPLSCPVCNEILLGIDKLTIHLFSHTINLHSNNTVEPLKHTNVFLNNNNSGTVHNSQNISFHDWNVCKTQTIDLKSSKNVQTTENEIPILNSTVSIQEQSLPVNNISQVAFLPNLICKSEGINAIQKIHENDKIKPKVNKKIIQETMGVNYATQNYVTNNIEHVNAVQDHAQREDTQNFKQWTGNQHCEEQNSVNENVRTEIKEITLANKYPVTSVTTICTNTVVEKYNDEKNEQDNSLITCNENQSQILENGQILSELKQIKPLSTKEKIERCNICGFHFPDYNILLLHKQLVHMINEKDLNVIPENFLKSYSCHLCSKIFKMRGSLMVHMRVAHMGYNLGSLAKGGQVELIFNENKYNCPTCGKIFKKEQHVIQHLKTHEAKQWECDVCSKMFTTKYFLKKHKRLHSGEMPYKCNICNKTFTFQQSYHKHRLYHKDDKPHACATCGRSFKELSTLHNHERIHTGEKPFACETCGKCFRQRVSYLVHRRIHTGVMPYKCTICGKNFRYKVSQRTHKCPAQQTGNMPQMNSIDLQVTQLSSTQNLNSNSCKLQKSCIEENQPVLNVINDEENKYVLIINTQGQHLLTKELNISRAQVVQEKEQKLDESMDANDKSEEIRNIWKNNIPDNSIFKGSDEITTKLYTETEKPLQEDTNDLFSMIISPLENGLSSPTAEMEHLRLSSPAQKEDTLKPYSRFRSIMYKANIDNTRMEENFNDQDNVTNTLQTINEESLKQLLYGINDK